MGTAILKVTQMYKIQIEYLLEKRIIALPFFAVLWNQVVYYGGHTLAKNLTHQNLEIGIDGLIPFVPWTLLIYVGCYIFWSVNYTICAMAEKYEAYRLFCADFISKTICFFFFVFLPTTNVRPEILGNTFWEIGMKLLYQMDAPTNLLPSIHCLVSWFSFIGIKKNKNVSMVYKLFSLLMAIAVCVSTLTTKQHVIVDVIAGILLAEISYWFAGLLLNKAKPAEVITKKHKIKCIEHY